jgi:hypothetical protein
MNGSQEHSLVYWARALAKRISAGLRVLAALAKSLQSVQAGDVRLLPDLDVLILTEADRRFLRRCRIALPHPDEKLPSYLKASPVLPFRGPFGEIW